MLGRYFILNGESDAQISPLMVQAMTDAQIPEVEVKEMWGTYRDLRIQYSLEQLRWWQPKNTTIRKPNKSFYFKFSIPKFGAVMLTSF